MKQERDEKFEIQSGQYAFPYHYLPHFDDQGVPSRARVLEWGFEYLCYQGVIADRVRSLTPESVLEVGAGDGFFLNSLAGVRRRLGVDLDDRAIALALVFSDGAEFRAVDVADVDELFDVVVSIEVLEHVPDGVVPGFLSSVIERARPGGHVLLSVPSTVQPLNPKHHRHYDEGLLREHLRASGHELEDLRFEYVYREPWWLKLHLKATFNRFWFFESVWTRSVYWKLIQDWCTRAEASDGRHVLAIGRRPG